MSRLNKETNYPIKGLSGLNIFINFLAAFQNNISTFMQIVSWCVFN